MGGSRVRIETTPGLWLFLAALILMLPLPWLFAFLAGSLVHELCHLCALELLRVRIWYLDIRAAGVYLKTAPMTPLQTAVSSLSGPIGALALLLFTRWLPRTAICAAVQSLYHLLPLYPLDGGRALQAIVELLPIRRKASLCKLLEWAAASFVMLFGIYCCIELHLGILPFAVSAGIIFRWLREKFLAKRAGTGYNRFDYQ